MNKQDFDKWFEATMNHPDKLKIKGIFTKSGAIEMLAEAKKKGYVVEETEHPVDELVPYPRFGLLLAKCINGVVVYYSPHWPASEGRIVPSPIGRMTDGMSP